MFNLFNHFIEKCKGQRVAVAVSGGPDSMALLHLCANADIKTTAITVDHNLREQSAAEALMVKGFARDIGVEHFTLKWVGDKPSVGVEEAARNARYDLMLNFCKENKIGILLIAHQADDNIETFLINLGRGSGVFGLAGLRSAQMWNGIKVLRPILDTRRADILQYCAENNINYINDPMNDDESFLRVKIRKNRHLLEEKLEISDERILLAINSLSEMRSATEQTIDRLIGSVEEREGGKIIFFVPFLFDLTRPVQLKFISKILQKVGGAQYPIRLDSVQNVLNKLYSGDMTMTLAHCTIRRLGDRVLIVPEGGSVSFNN
jgi:tRNA(Ile)-lysidine synthase